MHFVDLVTRHSASVYGGSHIQLCSARTHRVFFYCTVGNV